MVLEFRNGGSGGGGTTNGPSLWAGGPPEAWREESQERAALNAVLEWLALYLPSWGTSVVLHVAVIILAAFLVWQNRTVEPAFAYTSAVVPDTKPKTEKRRREAEESRGKLKPQPSSIVRKFTQNPFPDVAPNNQSQLQVIGVEGGGKAIGEFDKAIVGLVKRLNAREKAVVSTILFLYRPPEAERMLKQISEENRGAGSVRGERGDVENRREWIDSGALVV